MDILEDYQAYLLTAYQVLSPYLFPVISTLRTLQTTTLRVFYPVLNPLFDRAAVFAQDQPAIISLILLGLILVISVQVLNFFRRIAMWTFAWVVTIGFWLCLALLVYTVVNRGVWKTVMDVVDGLKVLVEVWKREYRRWDGVQRQAQTYAKAQAQAQGRGRGNARTGWR